MYVLGDAADAGDMPRSASAAASQAAYCATALTAELTGAATPPAALTNACYFLTRPESGLIMSGRYVARDGHITGIEAINSEAREAPDVRRRRAADADRWYAEITRQMFE